MISTYNLKDMEVLMDNKSSNGSKLAKSTLALVIFSLIGKIFGFFRESLTANVFGTTVEMSAYSLAQAATAMIAGFVTNSIATTFIPALQKAEQDLGSERKNYFTNNLMAISSVVSIILILLGWYFPKQLAFLTASKASPETFKIVVKLIQLGMPVVIFSCWVGVFTGYLQYGGKFAATGAISIPLNLVYIVYLMIFSHHIGIVGLTLASVFGALAQFLFLLPGSFKLGYRPQLIFDLKDKYVREAIELSLPVLVSVSVNDINTAVNRSLASGMGDKAPSILYFSNKMNTLFIGIFIAAITAIIFPILTRSFGKGNIEYGKKVMNASIKSTLFLTVPATIGMIILARPLIEIAFVHGKFTALDGVKATSTLRFYSLSLISISLTNVLNRIYYSLHDTKTPFIIGVINVVINVGLNLLVAHKFGTDGLACAVSIATTCAVLMGFYLLRKKIGNLGTKSYIKALVKTLMASSAMGLVACIYFPLENLLALISSGGLFTLLRLILLMIVVFIAAIIYLIILYYLGVREIRDLTHIFKEKLQTRKLKNINE